MPTYSARKTSRAIPFIPKSKKGQFLVAVASVCCVVLAAWYVATTATRSETAAEQFEERYQYVDQSTYRSKR